MDYDDETVVYPPSAGTSFGAVPPVKVMAVAPGICGWL
jgi:hypothetical protein